MIEFLEETHQYLVNGILTPSVTTILSATLFKDQYKDIPKYILDNAADFGNKVHKAVETGDTSELGLYSSIAYEQYERVIRRYQIALHEQEQIVHYDDLYTGTFDMTGYVNNIFSILDVKTTYKLNEEYLSWQLSFYKYAYERMYGKELHKAYVIWIPKNEVGQLKEIEFKSEQEVMELVKQYENLQR